MPRVALRVLFGSVGFGLFVLVVAAALVGERSVGTNTPWPGTRALEEVRRGTPRQLAGAGRATRVGRGVDGMRNTALQTTLNERFYQRLGRRARSIWHSERQRDPFNGY
jgi:hypothetical protein